MGYLNEDGLATLVGKVKGQVVQLTSAEYRALPASKNTDNKTYFVTDEDYAYAIDDEPTLNSDNLVKSGGVYTYTSKIGSGTLSTTAQTIIPAINELDAAIDGLIANSIVSSSFTPKLYDLNTFVRDLPACNYFKIGKLYIMFLNFDASVIWTGVSTMIQIRNLPCQYCIGGTMYFQGLSTAAKDAHKGQYIQGSGSSAFVRDNVTSSDVSAGYLVQGVLFGFDAN